MYTYILDNRVLNVLIVFGIIFFVYLTKRVLSRYIASLLFIPIEKKWKSVEKNEFISLIIKPLGAFLTISIAVIAIDNLFFPENWKFTIYGVGFNIILHKAGIGLSLVYLIWVLLRFIDFIALVLDINAKNTQDKSDDQVIVFFRDFFKVLVYIAGVLIILKAVFGANIGSIFTGLSIVGAALALAAKESIENLIASFIIFFDKPFYTGDIVKVNTINGTVEQIGLRSTRIRTVDQTLVTVPNKQMVDSIVDNWSMRNGRRSEIKLGLSITTDTALIQTFITEIRTFLDAKKNIITKSTVVIAEYNKNEIIVMVDYIANLTSIEESLFLKEELNIFLKDLVEKLEISLAKTDPLL